MKRLTLGFFILTLIFMAFVMLLPSVSGEEGTRVEEGKESKIYFYHRDWIVDKGDWINRENETIFMQGNLQVQGSLILNNITIIFNCTYNGEFGIVVMPEGELFILDHSTVTSLTDMHYTFRVLADKAKDGVLIVKDSSISGCGYLSTKSENTGICIGSSEVSFSGAVISGNYVGIRFHEVEDEVKDEIEDDIEIIDTIFSQNHNALVLDYSSGIIIQGNTFQKNFEGLVLSHSSRVRVSNNSFVGNLVCILIDNSTECSINDNIFRDNTGAGVGVDYSSLISINGNRVENTRSGDANMLGTGIKLRGTDGCIVHGNTLRNNDIGMMMLSNNSDINVQWITIQGGRFGLYLYNENLPGEFGYIRVSGTREAGFSAKYCTNQLFFNYTSYSNHRYVLNVTASEIEFMYPEFDEMNNLVDEKSVVHLFYHIRVQTLEHSGTPLTGCDVRITNDERIVHASGGYDGRDPTTDSHGYTAWIPLEYATLSGNEENISVIKISVCWEDRELGRIIYGISEEIVRFYFHIPDLTISENDIILTPSNPDHQEVVRVAATVTNLGSMDINVSLTLYHVLGPWDIEIDNVVGDISLPRWSELIGKESILVQEMSKRTVEFEWVAEVAGDHTLLILIDEEMEVIELRKDNNAALLHVGIEEGDILSPPMAEIGMDIPQSLNNSNLSSTFLNLSVTLWNQGTLNGIVNLRVSLYQGEETMLIFNEHFTAQAGKGITVQVPVTMEPGDALINITLLSKEGEKALRILSPYLSLILHVHNGTLLHGTGGDEGTFPGVIVYSTTAGVVSFFIAFVAFAESARYRFLLLFIPLYMRMSKKDIEEQYTRGEILGYIKQNPGESYNNIKRDLEMSNGKLAYHLSVLDKGGFIKSAADGMYRRYYPKKMKVTQYGRITSVQEEILLRIEETPGISQKDLSRLVDLSTATVNYHVRKLTAKDLIVSKKRGIFVHYYLNGMTVDEIMNNALPRERRAPAKQ